MSIGDIIKSAIRAAAPDDAGAFHPDVAPPSPQEAEHHCAALADLAAERLRAARAERARAAADLRAAEAALARVRGLIARASAAERDADEAEAAERNATKLWAAAGAPDPRPPEIERLGDAAEAAARARNAALVAADGAREALPAVSAAEDDARVAMSAAEMRLSSAAVAVLAARAERSFIELAAARAAYTEALRPVASLRHLVRPWGPAHPLHGFSQSDLGAEIDARLRELAIGPPPEPDVRGGAADLAAEARRLVAGGGDSV